MPKVTSKLQLTVPKTIAEHYGIKPGDELQWIPAGETIRVIPSKRRRSERELTLKDRLRIFDEATERQRRREAARAAIARGVAKDRGWQREDLYTRGRPD